MAGFSADAVARQLDGLLASRPGGAPGEILIGLVGRGIAASRSPAMHEREAARLGLPCRYLLLDFDRLDLPDTALAALLSAAARAGFRGVNVTHPFKRDAVALLDGRAPEVQEIGAANTIVFAGGRAIGHNTDSWGFAESFRTGMAGAPLDRVALFGAGGAGAAVAHALLGAGAGEVLLLDTVPERAAALAARLAAGRGRARPAADPAVAMAEAAGIVNTTPVGMAKYPGLPFPEGLLQPRHWVAEIVYFPAETDLLRLARRRGCRTLAGAGMAIAQAARAFELFTGAKADTRAMAAHFEAAA